MFVGAVTLPERVSDCQKFYGLTINWECELFYLTYVEFVSTLPYVQ